MRILIATDAWYHRLTASSGRSEAAKALRALDHQLLLLTPRARDDPSAALFGDPPAIPAPGDIGRAIEAFAPDAIYIATEGLIGSAARRWCLRRGLQFATGFHTRFPEFAAARLPLPGGHARL